jgi:hypothetical protein
MAAPTEVFVNGTGTITATGESSGLLLQTNKLLNRVTFGFRGTFTSVVVAVRGHATGLSATSYFPIPGVYLGSGLPVSNPLSISLTNSTNAGITFDTTGCDYVEIWVVSGTPTSFSVDEWQFASDANTPPLIVQAQTSSTTISANQTFTDNTELYFGTGNDIGITWDGTDLLVSQAAADSIIKWGVSGAGINHVFYGDTATYDMTWDQSNDQLLFADNAKLAIGSGAGSAGDITFSWDATRLNVNQLTTNSAIRWGVDGAGIDQVWYGDTASTSMTWDQSADSLILTGAAPLVFTGTTGQPFIGLTDNLADALSVGISGASDLLVLTTTDNAEAVAVTGLRSVGTTAVAITGATTLKLSDSGRIFTASQAAAYDIDLPSPTSGNGCTYEFSLTAAGANDVTVTVAGSAATFVGILQNDVTGTVPCTGSTLTFKSGVAALGDMIQIKSISTSLYRVYAACSANGGITIT